MASDLARLTYACLARACLRRPIVSVLEGGYNVEALERAVRAHVGALIETVEAPRMPGM